jgi:hypothetical protein
METKKLIPKRIDSAFGKKVYLLGIDKDGQYAWLEEATWDCGWYWGFGYITRFNVGRGKNPNLSTDIRSLTHYSGIIGEHEIWDTDKKTFVNDHQYVHHINNDNAGFKSTVLTDKEAWQLSELMKTFYTLQEAAEVFKHGGSNYTTIASEQKIVRRQAWFEEINKKILPDIFKEIYKILSP